MDLTYSYLTYSPGTGDDEVSCQTIGELQLWIKQMMSKMTSGFANRLEGVEEGLTTLASAVNGVEVYTYFGTF